MRSNRNACAAGSHRSVSDAGTGTGRRAAAMVLMSVLLRVRPRVLARHPFASAARENLLLGGDQLAEAVVVLAACRATLEVRPHVRHRRIGVTAAGLGLDVL